MADTSMNFWSTLGCLIYKITTMKQRSFKAQKLIVGVHSMNSHLYTGKCYCYLIEFVVNCIILQIISYYSYTENNFL